MCVSLTMPHERVTPGKLKLMALIELHVLHLHVLQSTWMEEGKKSTWLCILVLIGA